MIFWPWPWPCIWGAWGQFWPTSAPVEFITLDQPAQLCSTLLFQHCWLRRDTTQQGAQEARSEHLYQGKYLRFKELMQMENWAVCKCHYTYANAWKHSSWCRFSVASRSSLYLWLGTSTSLKFLLMPQFHGVKMNHLFHWPCHHGAPNADLGQSPDHCFCVCPRV